MDFESMAVADAFTLREITERVGEPLKETDTDEVREISGLREEVLVIKMSVAETKADCDALKDTVGEFDAVFVAVRLTPATAAAMHARRTPRMSMLGCACARWGCARGKGRGDELEEHRNWSGEGENGEKMMEAIAM